MMSRLDGSAVVVTHDTFELPEDGVVTRAVFEQLPDPSRGWAWELRAGRLVLTHMPVSFWHSEIIWLILQFWRRLGYQVAIEQYVGDSGFVRGGGGRHNLVADGVAFAPGYEPPHRGCTHAPENIHIIVEAVSDGSEENDAVEKFSVYAKLGVERYWIVRIDGDGEAGTVDGTISMFELRDGVYEATGQRLVSELNAEATQV